MNKKLLFVLDIKTALTELNENSSPWLARSKNYCELLFPLLSDNNPFGVPRPLSEKYMGTAEILCRGITVYPFLMFTCIIDGNSDNNVCSLKILQNTCRPTLSLPECEVESVWQSV